MPSPSPQIKSSALWLLLGNFFNRALGLAAMVVVARILAPDQIGLVTLATAAWGLITAVFSMSTDAAIIHYQKHDLAYLDTAFWLNLAVFGVLLLAMLGLAPVAAAYYHNPELTKVIYCFGAAAFFASLMQIHDSIFNRELSFRTLTVFTVAFQSLEALAMMALALGGAGYWSLVLPKLGLAPLKAAVWWRFCSWRPRLNFSWEHARGLLRYSLQFQGARLMMFINLNADFLIVGKLLDSFRLGLYSFAYDKANWPITNFVFLLNNLGLPYFARVKDDLPFLRTQYLKMMRMIAVLAFPVFLGSILVAPEAIPLVFGAKWTPSVPAFQLLCLFGLIRSIGSPGGQVLLACGRPDLLFRFNLLQAPVLVAGILLGVRSGITGVAAASLVVLGGGGLIFMGLTQRVIGLPVRALFDAVWPALLSAAAMAGVLGGFRGLYYQRASSALGLILLAVPLGVAVYLLVLGSAFRPVLAEGWRLAVQSWRDFFESRRGPLTVLPKEG